ncbi:hypothetical protein [uncultured Ruminococcus sp.]|uniref:hypothetical protein n=1 Tax=uncultured Ruminococcus sp. TaxID=165186 RepID=UPI0025CC28B0|nr:hypothetical protein [uncultured Ruminococcus sp.]
MAECMNFPETPLEFLKLCEFKDEKEIYTNGSMLIPTFRVEQMIEHYFNSTSTADVQKVRHGKWEDNAEDVYWGNHFTRKHCSECGNKPEYREGKNSYVLSDYCRNCGAKMDKE